MSNDDYKHCGMQSNMSDAAPSWCLINRCFSSPWNDSELWPRILSAEEHVLLPLTEVRLDPVRLVQCELKLHAWHASQDYVREKVGHAALRECRMQRIFSTQIKLCSVNLQRILLLVLQGCHPTRTAL